MNQLVKNSPEMQYTRVQALGQEDPLEEMATHPSIFAWEIPRAKKPVGLQSVWTTVHN